MWKNFLRRSFDVLIIMGVFALLLYAIVGSIACDQQREYEREKEFFEQYMQSIPVDEEGYEISFEEGLETVLYESLEKTVLDDGETVFDYIKKVGLVLENNGERKLIGFEFLVEKSEKFRKVIDVWEVYNGVPLGTRYERMDSDADLCVCTDGIDIYYIYEEGHNSRGINGEIPPSLFKYDISEDKVLYLGCYMDFPFSFFKNMPKIIIDK